MCKGKLICMINFKTRPLNKCETPILISCSDERIFPILVSILPDKES